MSSGLSRTAPGTGTAAGGPSFLKKQGVKYRNHLADQLTSHSLDVQDISNDTKQMSGSYEAIAGYPGAKFSNFMN